MSFGDKSVKKTRLYYKADECNINGVGASSANIKFFRANFTVNNYVVFTTRGRDAWVHYSKCSALMSDPHVEGSLRASAPDEASADFMSLYFKSTVKCASRVHGRHC